MVEPMTQPSGWYDDPQDTTQLRYWDGVAWSSHTSPRVSPTVAQSTIGMPYGVLPASERPEAPGSHGAQGASSPGGGVGQTPQDTRPEQGGQWPAYGQGPGQGAPQLAGWQSHPGPTTPDGVALSGWWKRVAARVLDGFIVGIVATPLVYEPMQRAMTLIGQWYDQVVVALKAGSSKPPDMPADLLAGPLLQVSLTILAVYVIYEVAFLTRTGATPGKRVMGISVRLRDRPGPPPLRAVLKRTAVQEGSRLLGRVPFVGGLASIFSLIDVLWPLWDDKRQAIHDKAAATNVVVGPQPKPDARP
jgi:uncharacterized RDD family membrane protein YckC